MKFQNIGRIAAGRFKAASTIVVVTESDPGGSGSVTLDLDVAAIALDNVGAFHARWISQQKQADGAFVGRKAGRLHVHLVELKTTVGIGTWRKALKQYDGVLLDMLAFLGVLSAGRPARVFIHIAYQVDAITPSTTASPVALKVGLGTGTLVANDCGWSAGVARVLDFEAPVNKIVRNLVGNARTSVTV